MSAFAIPELPPDLAAKAAEVPGLDVRLLMFIRQEVSLHERRQSRFSAEAREIVRQAKARAEELKQEGLTPEQSRTEFLELYDVLIERQPAAP